MGNSCQILTRYTPACKFAECSTGGQNFKSNSASPSDIWEIHWNNNVKYEGKKIQKAIMKSWISSDSCEFLTDYKIITVSELAKLKIDALTYELDIYKNIVRPLIDYNICPHFVKFYGNGSRCTFKEHTKNVGALYNPRIDTHYIGLALFHQLEYLTLNKKYRPDFTQLLQNTSQPNLTKQVLDQFFKRITYNTMINEFVPQYTLEKFMSDVKDPKELYEVLFQIMYSLWVLYKTKTTHNDCHLGNVFIEDLKSAKKRIYIINKRPYIINSRFFVRIFDFDRGYSVQLGQNKLLEYPSNFYYGNKSAPFPNFDMFKVLILLTAASNKLKNPTLRNELKTTIGYTLNFKEGSALQNYLLSNFNNTQAIMDIAHLPKFYSMLFNPNIDNTYIIFMNIISECGRMKIFTQLNKVNELYRLDKKYVYSASDDMFDSRSGLLLTENIKNYEIVSLPIQLPEKTCIYRNEYKIMDILKGGIKFNNDNCIKECEYGNLRLYIESVLSTYIYKNARFSVKITRTVFEAVDDLKKEQILKIFQTRTYEGKELNEILKFMPTNSFFTDYINNRETKETLLKQIFTANPIAISFLTLHILFILNKMNTQPGMSPIRDRLYKKLLVSTIRGNREVIERSGDRPKRDILGTVQIENPIIRSALSFGEEKFVIGRDGCRLGIGGDGIYPKLATSIGIPVLCNVSGGLWMFPFSELFPVCNVKSFFALSWHLIFGMCIDGGHTFQESLVGMRMAHLIQTHIKGPHSNSAIQTVLDKLHVFSRTDYNKIDDMDFKKASSIVTQVISDFQQQDSTNITKAEFVKALTFLDYENNKTTDFKDNIKTFIDSTPPEIKDYLDKGLKSKEIYEYMNTYCQR